MSDPYLGEIRPFAGSFAPRGWHYCDGALLAIANNDALYALIGTTYGGDGITTFGLPDLRGRVPVGQGQGPGLSSYVVGQMAGEAEHTLITAELPAHTHTVLANAGAAVGPAPVGKMPAAPADGTVYFLPPNVGTQTSVTPDATAIGQAGGSQPHNNMMPTLTIGYIIAVEGIFPSRN